MSKTLLTRGGYDKLLTELKHLCQVVRPQARMELMEATLEGPRENNLFYREARSRHDRVDRRIRQLQQLLSESEVVVGGNLRPRAVIFDSRVKVVNLQSGKTLTFHLVGAVEADPLHGRLSITSPLGQALLGRQVGEYIRVHAPGGLRDYQILAIDRETP